MVFLGLPLAAVVPTYQPSIHTVNYDIHNYNLIFSEHPIFHDTIYLLWQGLIEITVESLRIAKKNVKGKVKA